MLQTPSKTTQTLLSPRIPRDNEHERYHPELEEELKECLFCLQRNAMMFDLEVDSDLIEQRIYERQALLCRYRYLLARARELGLQDTHFTNPNGLDAPEHYSTALDLARLTRAALQVPAFAEVVATRQITIEGRSFTNHNRLLWSLDGAIGVKTQTIATSTTSRAMFTRHAMMRKYSGRRVSPTARRMPEPTLYKKDGMVPSM